MGIFELIKESGNGGTLDIKVNKKIAPSGPMTGKLLQGKYVSARTAGNFLFGLNTAKRAWGHRGLVMNVAGMYNIYKNNHSVRSYMTSIIAADAIPERRPYAGEDPYSGWAIDKGFEYAYSSLGYKFVW